jgi:hypothetical protein
MINVSKTDTTQKQIQIICELGNVTTKIKEHFDLGYTYVGQILMPSHLSCKEFILIFNVPEPVEKKPIVAKPWR